MQVCAADNITTHMTKKQRELTSSGSGTILDALRISAPLVVVPNTTLLDNHQIELAEELSRQDYVVHGSLETPDGLERAMLQCEQWKKKRKDWSAVNSGPRAPSIQHVLDEEAGFIKLD